MGLLQVALLGPLPGKTGKAYGKRVKVGCNRAGPPSNRKTAGGIFNRLFLSIREGKSESEVTSALQEMDAKNWIRLPGGNR